MPLCREGVSLGRESHFHQIIERVWKELTGAAPEPWEHEIRTEKILPPHPDLKHPLCVKGKRACPPEDCGGPWGYADLPAALASPDHPRREECLD